LHFAFYILRFPSRLLSFACIVSCFAAISSCASEPANLVISWNGSTFGTTYSVQYHGAPPGTIRASVRQAVEKRLARIDREMSTWRSDSGVSRFNDYRGTNWFDVSFDTSLVVSTALRISELTGGAFDVTVLPLVRLWGFGPEGRRDRLPTDAEVAAARARVDYRRLHARLDPPSIQKDLPDINVDLSAIAKGYAADAVAESLNSMGITEFLVGIGGEMRAGGLNPAGKAWRVGIERPVEDTRQIQRVVGLSNLGVSTSGDYRNFYMLGGKRCAHIIDPRTGLPADSSLRSVSVLHASTMCADALATGLMVLGSDLGLKLARKEGLGVFMILGAPDGLSTRSTPAFEALMSPPGN
jgi:thiamine biosynthesis lipoprotein